MQVEFSLWKMGVLIDMIDSIGVEGAGPADNPMDLVAFAEEQLSQITAVLACNPGYKSSFHSNLEYFLFGQLRLIDLRFSTFTQLLLLR
jgi:hypothetical protein